MSRQDLRKKKLDRKQNKTAGCIGNEAYRYKSNIRLKLWMHIADLKGDSVSKKQKLKEKNTMANKSLVPEAKEALNKFKMEAASEVGVNLKQGYNGDLTSKQAGSVGGQMVKKMIQNAENSLK